MSKLVIVIGDYSAGTIETAVKNKEDIATLRSGDSADSRVLSEIIAQDPTVNRVITLPIARQFSPSSAGALTKEAIKFGFNILEHPGTVKGFEDVTEVSIVGNVAPGIKSLKGSNIGQPDKESNANREAFFDGTVSKNGKTIHVGTTNAFLDGYGHAMGAATELEKEGYTFSEFKTLGGEEANRLLKENGQFRSRALLAYMNRVAGKPHEHEGEDLLPLIRAQHGMIGNDLKRADEAYAKDFLKLSNFVPVVPGDAHKGYVTIISSSDKIDSALRTYAGSNAYSGQLISGISFDGNETAQDRKIIAALNEEERANYRLTRQAFFIATLANEFHRDYDSGPRTFVIDKQDKTPDAPYYNATLTNGSVIRTQDPRLIALTTDTLESVTLDGKKLTGMALRNFRKQAEGFRHFLADKAVENDPYRNVKLARTFGQHLQDVKQAVKEASGNEDVPEDKVAELTITAKTGALTEERIVYYIPSSTSSFGVWGHPKLSSGSTILDKEKAKENYQGEIFTPGCPTAGYLFTVVPGVTQFNISNAQLIDKSLLDTPSLRLTGQNGKYGIHKSVNSARVYHDVHDKHVQEILRKTADGKITP